MAQLVAEPETDRRPVTTPTNEAVVVDRICKQFGGVLRWPWQPAREPVRALTDISFTIGKGEVFGLLGANGSGKSTIIRILSTLILPDAGRATVFGHDVVRDDRAVKYLINRVSVEASFFKRLSPLENLLYACRLYGRGAEARRDILRTLDLLGITEAQAKRPLETMSRGMQQKVAIARALLTAPVLLLLDEPTTGLDPRSKQEVQHFVRAVRDSHDATVLLCTHDMEEAEALTDRIAVVDQGRVVALGTSAQLKSRLHHEGHDNPTMEDVFMDLTGKSLKDDAERKN
ncbi:MAG: ABC transporter ATP-binding protein [Thermomicrobia bacterium]|nr:ABC transporter ATP-binding protein [Thermomicrobia bacterium]